VSKTSIKKDKLQRPFGAPHPSKKTRIKELDDVVIQVTQVFCPNGHNLVRNRRQLFDGSPGISLLVSDGDTSDTVILSPYHGDASRKGKASFPDGTRVEVSCPVCKAQLPKLGACNCEGDGELFMLYLTPELDDGRVVALCNVWGCHRSKVFDQAQLLSAYLQD
jgi:hypothetical protein